VPAPGVADPMVGVQDGEFSPGHQAVPHGEQGSRGAGGDADLGVGVLDVVVGGLDRDPERARATCLVCRPRASRPMTSASRSVSPAGRSIRGTRCPAASSTAPTAPGSSRPAPASRPRASAPTPAPSSTRSCRRSWRGRSGRRRPPGSPSRSWPSSAATATWSHRSGASAKPCWRPGWATSSRSCWSAPPTCCTCSAPGHGRGPGRLLRPPPAHSPLTANSWGWPPRWNGTMVTLTFSIEPSTLVRPAEVWSCRTRRQKPT
jgi:hypothetical protein